MPPLQFQQLSSQPTPGFWSALTSVKLDKLKLDDTRLTITGHLSEARQTVDREKVPTSADGVGPSDGAIGIDGVLSVDADAFAEEDITSLPGTIPVQGSFKNFNTIEEFKSADTKKELFNQLVDEARVLKEDQILASFESPDPNLNPFLLVTFADLKKYIYHYWFAFPALVSKPAWETHEAGFAALPQSEEDEARHLGERLADAGSSLANGFLLKGVAGQRVAAPISQADQFFEGVEAEDRYVAFHDPSSSPDTPGWPLRNILYYLARRHGLTAFNVICLRQDSSRIGQVSLPGPLDSARPQASGWERTKQGKLASRVADLGPTMDPTRLADQAVDLNLKLMRWRIMPSLELEKIASTKCLLLGAGTLGCYVAQSLMGWGIRHITFVDSARVSYSNPVRQPLFEFEDCLNGGKPKAQCAADRLKRIFPGVHASAHSLLIPMPGHPVPSSSESAVQADIAKLEELIQTHDAVFLLMDSRESRWLPTVIGAAEGKIVMNAALGFDSYLVMRHGASPAKQAEAGGRRLGCYYCNDVVAPTDSLTDRTLDQMCTVTRPGIAPLAAASAVELLVSLVQHPLGVAAPAEGQASSQQSAEAPAGSPLGLVPHQLRGQLSQWKTLLIEGQAYDRCTGCSPAIIDAYRNEGFSFLLKAFSDADHLERVTGLDKLHAESEAMMEQVEWDEGSEEDF